MKFLSNLLVKYQEQLYAVSRIVIGLLFSFHGIQKIFGILTDHQPPAGSQIWIGGLIELLGGLMIALGFKTRIASFLACGTMAVAYIQFHWKFQFSSQFFPAINKGELALVYCFIFLVFAGKGSGMFSIDRLTTKEP